MYHLSEDHLVEKAQYLSENFLNDLIDDTTGSGDDNDDGGSGDDNEVPISSVTQYDQYGNDISTKAGEQQAGTVKKSDFGTITDDIGNVLKSLTGAYQVYKNPAGTKSTGSGLFGTANNKWLLPVGIGAGALVLIFALSKKK